MGGTSHAFGKCTANLTKLLGTGRRHGSRLPLKSDMINIYCMHKLWLAKEVGYND